MKSYSSSPNPLGLTPIWSTCNVAHPDIERIELCNDGQVCVLRAVTLGHKRKCWVTLQWDGETLKDRFYSYKEGTGRGQTDDVLQAIFYELRKAKRVEEKEELTMEDLLNAED